jgi:signal transduction histidine kinase
LSLSPIKILNKIRKLIFYSERATKSFPGFCQQLFLVFIFFDPNFRTNFGLMLQFTALKRISIKNNRPLRRLLPLAYPIAMAAILGTSATFFYILLARSFNQQLDEQLLNLGRAAVPSLDIVKTKGYQGLNRSLPWGYLLSTHQQSIEWFDAESQLLAQEGTRVPKFLPLKNLSTKSLSEGSPLFQKQGSIRSVTITVYAKNTYEANLGRTKRLLEGYIRASQSTQEMEATLYQLRLGLGLVGITILILISISGFYLARPPLESIEQAPQVIEQSFQATDQFAVNLSHHLRNLVTRINLAVELMLNHSERFGPSDSRKLETIKVATQQMQRLIEDLLFLTRNNSDAIAPEMEKLVLPLDEMLHSVIGRFEPIATAKEITLEVHLSPDISVKGDAAQLNRLFSILLDNAFKYTDAGGTVTLSLTKSSGVAVVTVEDTGIGIPSESLPFVFRWFWHSEPKRERQHEGLGLGLAIAQTIVEQHGGKISVVSREGIGSSFQVNLPVGLENVKPLRGKAQGRRQLCKRNWFGLEEA